MAALEIGGITYIKRWVHSDIVANNGSDYLINKCTIWASCSIPSGVLLSFYVSNGSDVQSSGNQWISCSIDSVTSSTGQDLFFTGYHYVEPIYGIIQYDVPNTGSQLRWKVSARGTTQSTPEITYVGIKYGDYIWQ